ncbi:DUF1772 domain-containing protein [Rhodobacteraceae bacterium D3-12]|nr:DUF1772 domain-containing protein [Rhodobacteraceae bacterium D3-12]
MHALLLPMAFLSLLLSGAIFGFFYAWVCSTMWGLDAADPQIAIPAMQAMNASVRNAVFAPAFFGTPVVLLVTAFLARGGGYPRAALLFGAAGLTYLFGGMALTMAINVPMNEALATLSVPSSRDDAAAIWAEYSPRWQLYNVVRTAFSGVTLLLTGAGLMALNRAT